MANRSFLNEEPKNVRTRFNAQYPTISHCLTPAHFAGMTPKEAYEAAFTCSTDIEEFLGNVGTKTSNYGESLAQRQLYSELNAALIQSQNLVDIPGNLDAAAKFLRLVNQLKPLAKEVVGLVCGTLVPFLEEGESSSLTLSVGPGDSIFQMYPHDEEFKQNVFDTHARNLVFVVEGSEEGGFGDAYKEMFQIESDIDANPWYQAFLEDLQTQFNIPADAITPTVIADSENEDYNKVITLQFSYNGGANEILIVFYYGDYERHKLEPQLTKMVAHTDFNTLICGIRTKECADIFFSHTDFFYNNFHIYTFVHGDYNTPPMKTKTSSFRVNLARMRTRGLPRTNVSDGLTLQPNGSEAMGYLTSRLCAQGIPNANNPYCVRGNKANAGAFWRGLGGKRKRQTKRKLKGKRKTRRSRV